MSITVKSCRYNTNGFVEELPQLPEKRTAHACAALPITGVKDQKQPHLLCRHSLLPEEEIYHHSSLLW